MRPGLRFYSALLITVSLTGCFSGSTAVDDLLSTGTGASVGNSAFSFSPAPYDFGPLQAQSGSSTTTLTLRNISNKFIFLSRLGGGNTHFTIDSNDCPITPNAIAPNATCSVIVTFAPTTGGVLSMALTAYYGLTPGTETYTSSGALSGTGVTPLNFNGIDSIDQTYCSSLRANWTNVAGAANYLVFKSLAGGGQQLLGTALPGTSNKTITGLTPGATYTLKVQATDGLGVVTNNAVTQTATLSAAPSITNVTDKNFPSNFLTQSQAMTTLNFVNTNTGNNTNMAYTCYYDKVPDGTVAATLPCSGLPGTASFNTATGQFDWTPSSTTTGPFEVKVTGTFFGECATSRTFVLDVRGSHTTTNLLGEWDADFADLTRPYISNPPALSDTWQNLSPAGGTYNGALSNTTWGSKWQGSGTVASPYRLVLNGATQDRVDFGTGLNAQTTLSFGAWLKFSDPTALNKVIFGNGGGGANGFVLRQSASAGKIELAVGNVDGLVGYQTIVASKNPVGYWKLDETSGTAMADSSGNANHGTATVNVTLGGGGAQGTTVNSASFSGSNSYINVASAAPLNITTGGLSIAVWVYPTSSSGYQALVAKGTNPYPYLLSLDNGTLYPSLYMSGINAAWNNRATTALTLNAWNHVVAVYDDALGTLKYYINGAAAGNYNVTAGALTTTAHALEIGTMINNAYPFTGSLDEVSIFNSVLSAADVTQLYSSFVSCRSLSTISSSTWNYISAIFDGPTKNAKLYVNNALQCSTTFVDDIGSPSTNLTLGAKADGTSAWSGEVAQLTSYQSNNATSLSDIYYATARRFFDIPIVNTTGLVMHADAARGNGVAFPGAGCAATTWTDVSSNAFTGTLSNFAACGATRGWQGTGIPADPYRVDFITGGAGNVVSFPDHANLRLTTGVTIFALIKIPAGQANYRTILGKGNGAPNYGYLYTLPVNSRKQSLYLSNNVGGDPNASWSNNSTTDVPVGSWNMIAVTWDSTTNMIKYYLNGLADGSFATTPGRTIGTNTESLKIGNMINDVYPFDGALPVVLLYNRALTLAELQANCTAYQPYFLGLSCQ